MNEKVTYDKLEDPFPEYKWPVSLGRVINFSSEEDSRTI